MKKNSTWYNNGEVEIQLQYGDRIPDGFVKGRLPEYVEWMKTIRTSGNPEAFLNSLTWQKSHFTGTKEEY